MFIVLLSFLLGVMLSGIWFGVTCALKLLSNKIASIILFRFSGAISAFISTIAILFLNKNYFLDIQSIVDWHWWTTTLFVAVITAFIVSQNTVEELPRGKELLWYGFDGVLMEIPQRLMMQSFVWYVLQKFNVKDALYISIFITALIWCVSIVIQNLIIKIKFNIQTVREIIASAFFSIGVGYILTKTMFILFPMVAHFIERIISTQLRAKKKD